MKIHWWKEILFLIVISVLFFLVIKGMDKVFGCEIKPNKIVPVEAEEIKEWVISKSELEDLKFLFIVIDAKIFKIENKTASIYNPPAKIRKIIIDFHDYHSAVKETIIELDKAIKDMGERKNAVSSEKNYKNIKAVQLMAVEIDKILNYIIEQLKKDFPEL